MLHSTCQHIWKTAVGTGLEKVSFTSIPKKSNAKECSNHRTISLISHPSKVMLKIFQAKLQQYVNWKLPYVQGGFRKGSRTSDQITKIHWITEKGNSRKTSTSDSLTTLKPLTVWITTNWKILKEMGMPDHLTCLLRNLYAGQETIVRTGHGTMDWFKMGKGVCQGYILSPCFFNLYTVYIMWNARLDEAQAGILRLRVKYQQPQICIWYQFNGRQWRAKEPLEEHARGLWKSWFKTQYSKN